MDDFIEFGKFVLRVGASSETYDLVVSWLWELILGKDFLDSLHSSELIPVLFGYYNSCDLIIQDCGRRMMSQVINSSSRISKENIFLFPLFLELCCSLGKKDPLYPQLRNTLCQKMLLLCEEGSREEIFKVFCSEILKEAYDGISSYIVSDVLINEESCFSGVGMLNSVILHSNNDLKRHVLP